MAEATPTVFFYICLHLHTDKAPPPTILSLIGWNMIRHDLVPAPLVGFFSLYIYNPCVVSRERAFSTGYSEDSQWIKGSCQHFDKNKSH